MRKPEFSVISPTLNEEKFLPQLLASLAAQTKRNFEVIVSDGSSQDQTVKLAQSFRQKLPALTIRLSPIASLPLQRNLGARAATANWLIFVDADSVLLPYFFERISQFIRETRPQFFTTWFRPDSEKTADALVTLLANLSIESSVSLKRPFAPGPLTIVKRQVFTKVHGYDEHLKYGEDIDLSRRIVESGVLLAVLRETLCVWSLRRFRKEGTLKVIQAYARTALSVLFTKRAPQQTGYLMGGHLYGDKGKSARQKGRLPNLKKRLRHIFKRR